MVFCLLLKEGEAKKKADDWISATIQTLKKASPTSLKISLRSVRLWMPYFATCNVFYDTILNDSLVEHQ